MKYRFIYKIICLCGEWKGKYYIGQHSTYNMNDGYAGSGTLIREYYRKYGKILNVTYKIKILKDNIKSQTELDRYEILYINQHLGKKKCLNLIEGGLNTGAIKLDMFHVIECEEDGTYRSCEVVDDNIVLYSNNEEIPIYEHKCGKLYSKASDLKKHCIVFYD